MQLARFSMESLLFQFWIVYKLIVKFLERLNELGEMKEGLNSYHFFKLSPFCLFIFLHGYLASWECRMNDMYLSCRWAFFESPATLSPSLCMCAF